MAGRCQARDGWRWADGCVCEVVGGGGPGPGIRCFSSAQPPSHTQSTPDPRACPRLWPKKPPRAFVGCDRKFDRNTLILLRCYIIIIIIIIIINCPTWSVFVSARRCYIIIDVYRICRSLTVEVSDFQPSGVEDVTFFTLRESPPITVYTAVSVSLRVSVR